MAYISNIAKKKHELYLLNFGKNCSNFDGQPKHMIKQVVQAIASMNTAPNIQ